MSDPIFAAANAYLDDQLTTLGDWAPDQFITLQLLFDSDPDSVWAPLKSDEARALAFRLLELAEHADRRARGDA